ncbi:MAG: porin family protein [Hyphomicrobiales bacterium]|nr:porin family protein [Hyphomicrobiales bacterium]
MFKTHLAAVAVCLAPFAAVAADLPSRAAAAPVLAVAAGQWTGFYAGVVGGYTQLRSTVHDNTAPLGIDQFDGADAFTQKPSGMMGGLSVGYNWQTGRFVLGAEADLSAAAVKKETFAAYDGDSSGDGMLTKMSAFGTLRARAGYAVTDSVLAYATGGLAYANLTQFAGDKDGGDDRRQYWDVKNSVASLNRWTPGWTLGGGVEAQVFANWSVRAEYLYADFGKYTAFATAMDNSDFRRGEIQNVAHVARLGVNYRFGGSAPSAIVAKY